MLPKSCATCAVLHALLFFAEMTTGSLFQLLLFVVTQRFLENLNSSRRKSYFYQNNLKLLLKDGAYYCYCAYVLRISRYSDLLSPLLTNTGIFLRGLKLSG